MDPEIRPPHAYVPGRNARHPDGWFDKIRATARPEMTPAELGQCAAFKTGQVYLDEGYDWEAHEVLEPVWMACPDPSDERYLVQAMIQLANARLKVRMKRPKAALRLCDIAAGHLEKVTGARVLGLSVQGLRQSVISFKNAI